FGEDLLEGAEALVDPVVVPRVDGRLVEVKLFLEPEEHAQVVEWMDVARDELRDAANSCPLQGRRRQERRAGMGLVEVLEDGHRLRERMTPVDERRDRLCGVDAGVIRRPVSALAQIEDDRFVRQRLQVERDPDAERRRRPDRLVELHRGTAEAAPGEGPPPGRISEEEEGAEEHAGVVRELVGGPALQGAGELEAEPHPRPRIDEEVRVPPGLLVPRPSELLGVVRVDVAVAAGEDDLPQRELRADEQGAEVDGVELAGPVESRDAGVDVGESGGVGRGDADWRTDGRASAQTGEEVGHPRAGGGLSELREGERTALARRRTPWRRRCGSGAPAGSCRRAVRAGPAAGRWWAGRPRRKPSGSRSARWRASRSRCRPGRGRCGCAEWRWRKSSLR